MLYASLQQQMHNKEKQMQNESLAGSSVAHHTLIFHGLCVCAIVPNIMLYKMTIKINVSQ